MSAKPKVKSVKDDFIAPAHRAMLRASRKARAENLRWGLPVITLTKKRMPKKTTLKPVKKRR